ncbi:MAG: hypothetical protein N2512_03400 [Armatimonadetes bacterium]|nr:hypothetical protein [Armatimonadota bacterium]
MRLPLVAFVAFCSAIAVADAPLPVVLAGRVVFRIADPGPYGSLHARLQAIDQQISEAISCEDVGSPKMRVAQRGGLWSVFIGKTFLASVYPGDAKLYGRPAKSVANLWAAELKIAFPLSEPLTRMGSPSKATMLDKPGAAAQARRPVKVPAEHWGIVNTYMMLLWKVRQAGQEAWGEEEPRLTAETLEDAARHYLAPANQAKGHEPGTCPGLRTCADCQAQMAAALMVEDEKRELVSNLAAAMAADERATRAVKQVFEYVRYIDQKRFMSERVRIAWQLWQRLAQRAAEMCQSLAAAQPPTEATP